MAKVRVKMGLDTDRVAPSWASKTKERELRKKMTMVFSGVLMKIIAQSIAINQSQGYLSNFATGSLKFPFFSKWPFLLIWRFLFFI